MSTFCIRSSSTYTMNEFLNFEFKLLRRALFHPIIVKFSKIHCRQSSVNASLQYLLYIICENVPLYTAWQTIFHRQLLLIECIYILKTFIKNTIKLRFLYLPLKVYYRLSLPGKKFLNCKNKWISRCIFLHFTEFKIHYRKCNSS